MAKDDIKFKFRGNLSGSTLHVPRVSTDHD
jgi:hypothetical protein